MWPKIMNSTQQFTIRTKPLQKVNQVVGYSHCCHHLANDYLNPLKPKKMRKNNIAKLPATSSKFVDKFRPRELTFVAR